MRPGDACPGSRGEGDTRRPPALTISLRPPNVVGAYQRGSRVLRDGAKVAEDVVWHVPGRYSMAGEIRGLDELVAWLGRRSGLGLTPDAGASPVGRAAGRSDPDPRPGGRMALVPAGGPVQHSRCTETRHAPASGAGPDLDVVYPQRPSVWTPRGNVFSIRCVPTQTMTGANGNRPSPHVHSCGGHLQKKSPGRWHIVDGRPPSHPPCQTGATRWRTSA